MKRAVLVFLLLPLSLTILAASRSRPVRNEVPTFNREIVRIFQENCQTCHHPGDIAPFSLMTYNDAYPYRHLIRLKTQLREMPPWKAAEGCGEFEGVRRLTQQQIDLIARWVDSGASEGRPEDLPAPLEFAGGWALGGPDLVLAMAQPYTPPANGEMYRCFVVPTNEGSRKWVSAIDVRPGDRTTVHHVIAFIDPLGTSESLDAEDSEPGYRCFGDPRFFPFSTLGGWAPGTRPMELPDGVAMSLPANARVVLQVHYHSNGSAPKPDRTEIGVYYSDKPVAKELRILPLVNNTFTIPAGDPNYEVRQTLVVPTFISGHALLINPHMHLLGKKMKVEAFLPDGQQVCLIDVQDWDFNWQGGYQYKNPIALPGGTRLELTAWYDNSASNPRNPNQPPKDVRWGEATTDEMAIAFVGFTLDGENLLGSGEP